MQDCSKYDELLSAYLDGEVSETEKAEIEAHLESCADCRKYLSLLRTMRDDLQQELPEAPEMLRRGVMYKIGLEQKRKRVLFGSFGKWTAIAAVCCLAVLGAVRLGGAGLQKSADAAAPMMAEADTAEVMYSTSAAVSNGFAADMETMNTAVNGMEAPAPEPKEKRMEEPAESNAFAYAADTANTEEAAAAPESIYDASRLPGYEAGMDALDSSISYCAVGILYSLPEGYPAKDWEEQMAPYGQRRWLVRSEVMDALAAEGIFDELYYGDLLADSGLIMELTEGENGT